MVRQGFGSFLAATGVDCGGIGGKGMKGEGSGTSFGDRGDYSRRDSPRSDFVGCSQAYNCLAEIIKTVSGRESTITILGESGTGKEIIARRIHLHSRRADGPFVPVDCTTLTGQLFESQLFGHVKGAFTGATGDTLGFFRAADGGTILLDEVAELESNLQAKLLRVLQESVVVPVGSTRPCAIDVRVICATNCDLKEMVRKGAFRPDLYFRLNVIQITIPPLRERREDILLLAEYFLEKQAQLYDEPPKTLSEQSRKILLEYDWPGNVRELANVMEQAYVMTRRSVIDFTTLPSSVFVGASLLPHSGGIRSLDEVKKNAVMEALSAANGRRTYAAKMLGISYRRLVRLMHKYAVTPNYH
jgi:transcriptional regulator with PAS, ATPase and Fis domain